MVAAELLYTYIYICVCVCAYIIYIHTHTFELNPLGQSPEAGRGEV